MAEDLAECIVEMARASEKPGKFASLTYHPHRQDSKLLELVVPCHSMASLEYKYSVGDLVRILHILHSAGFTVSMTRLTDFFESIRADRVANRRERRHLLFNASGEFFNELCSAIP